MHFKRLISCLAPTVYCLLAAGCNIINPSEPVPTYVHLDSFAFSGVSDTVRSHKITAVYAFFNNQSIGNFNLPVTFPVLADAPGVLSLFPAIDLNGLSGLESPYAFYTNTIDTIHPAPGTTINLTPLTRYQLTSKFQFFEGFESTPHFVLLSGHDTLKATSDAGKVFEGFRSGYLHLAAANDTATNESDSFILPSNAESFLELDYKSSMPVQVGLTTFATNTGSNYTEYLIGLNPRTTWGKVYISLRSFAASHQGALYNILIRAQVPSDQAGGDLNIDNIKVVSF